MKKIISLLLVLIVMSACSNQKKEVFTKDNVLEIVTRERKFDTTTSNFQFTSNSEFEVIDDVAYISDQESASSVEVAFYKKGSIDKELKTNVENELNTVFKESNIKLEEEVSIKLSNYREVEILKINYSFSFANKNNQVVRYFVPTNKGIVTITYTIVDNQDNYTTVVDQILKTIY